MRPPAGLAQEIVGAIHGIGDPFFSRFATLEAAREALANDDPWCLGGKAFWHLLLCVDLALGDVEHFEAWAEAQSLSPLVRCQSTELIARFRDVERSER